jgi:3-mercaptopyruvate sulfurtransferase SseA
VGRSLSVVSAPASRSASSSQGKGSPLIETSELETLIKEHPEKIAVLNATLAIGNLVPRDEHIKARIPGSIFYDFNDFSNSANTEAPYTVPSEAQFKESMRKLNVKKNDIIVVYDKIGMVSAPRAFWVLKTFGAQNVRILNGVFNKWQAEQRQIESGDVETAWRKAIGNAQAVADPEEWNFQYDSTKVRRYEEVVKIAK